jgi:hypothetical protein
VDDWEQLMLDVAASRSDRDATTRRLKAAEEATAEAIAKPLPRKIQFPSSQIPSGQ